MRLAHGLLTFLAHPGVPPDQGGVSPADELGMGIHGGTDETSIMLHLAPELVDMDARRAATCRRSSPMNRYVRFGGRGRASGGCRTTSTPTGTSATRRHATAELGKELFDGAVRAFGEALREIAVFDFGR